MKILFALWYGDLGQGGGSAVAAKNMIESLLKYKDVEMHVVYKAGTEGTLVNWLANHKISFTSVSGVSLHCWPKVKNLKDLIKFPYTCSRHFVYYFLSVHEMKRVIRRVKPDIVHVNNSVLNYGIKAADSLKVPSLWHIREYADFDFDFDLIPTKHFFRKRVQKHYTASITADVMHHWGCTDVNRHFVVHDGVMSKTDVAYIDDKEDYFLFTGAVTHNKGVSDLINAFVIYAKKNSKGELWIAGKYNDEAYYNKLQSIITSNSINDRVKFLGFRSDRYELMQRARACIVPSLFEGFGFITVEAMMNGSLVVGRNSSGTKMIMETCGNSDFLYDNIEELASQMEQIMNKNSLYYRDHVIKVQNMAADKFSIERYGDDVYGIYNSILKNHAE